MRRDDARLLVATGMAICGSVVGALAVGLVAAFLTEGFQLGAQVISLQAGYSFATTIDPTSGADSTVLLTIAQLAAGPPDHRMPPEETAGDQLQPPHPVVVPADVSQLVRQYGFQFLNAEIDQRASGNQNHGPYPSNDGGDLS